jgi:uncharacterized membrane protein
VQVEAGWRRPARTAPVRPSPGALVRRRAQNRQAERDRRTSSRTQADTEYLARELAAIRLALGEMPTRDYLDDELARLRSELERLRAQVQPRSAADAPHADDSAV